MAERLFLVAGNVEDLDDFGCGRGAVEGVLEDADFPENRVDLRALLWPVVRDVRGRLLVGLI